LKAKQKERRAKRERKMQ